MSSEEMKQFYEDDVVYRFEKHEIIFGVVVNVHEDLEYDDSDDFDALQQGQIRIVWLNDMTQQKEVWKENEVTLMSRNIKPGDIVRRLEQGKETQRGYCRVVRQRAAVQIVGTDKVIENVSHDRLVNMINIDYGTPVCHENKIGRVLDFEQRVTLLSKCGSVVEILDSINDHIEDYWSLRTNNYHIDDYHVGQEVTAFPSDFQLANWIKKSKRMERKFNTSQRFTVQKVEINKIEVAWQVIDHCKFCLKSDIDNEDIPKLKLLEIAREKFLKLPARRLLKIEVSDIQIRKYDFILKQSGMHSPKNQKQIHRVVKRNNQRSSKKIKMISNVELKKPEDDKWSTEDIEYNSDNGSASSSNLRRKYYPRKAKQFVPEHITLPVNILCMDSKATIVWQDGTEEKDIPTTQLYYSTTMDDHEFFPGEFVILEDEQQYEKYGIVQEVDYFQRTAFIKWFIYSLEEKKPILNCTNEMSVYDIFKHLEFTFQPGCIVYNKAMQLGTVVDSIADGYILVKWFSGLEEECCPQDIELLPFDDPHDFDFKVLMPWEADSPDFIPAPISYKPILLNMAKDFHVLKTRIASLIQNLRQQTLIENVVICRDILQDSIFNRIECSFLQKIQEITKKEPHIDSQTNQMKSTKMKNVKNTNLPIQNVEDKEELTPDVKGATVLEKMKWKKFLSLIQHIVDVAYNKILWQIEKAPSKSNASEELTVPFPNFIETSENLAEVVIPTSSNFPATSEDSLLTPPKLTLVKPREKEIYAIFDEAPTYHRFYNNIIEPIDNQKFLKRIQKETKLLRESLPSGVWVRSYSNRLDLMSVMIRGPNCTPYEDGLFLFDIQLCADYPHSPPLVEYISYSTEQLNPNLYVEGTVCVSLLGTWFGDTSEEWGPNSTLLQLIVSIQSLILVEEPYYNEPRYEKLRVTQHDSRTYNELIVLKLVQSLTKLLITAPDIFKEEILHHFSENVEKLYKRLKSYMNDEDPPKPEFPLLPVTKGLKLSLNKALDIFKDTLKRVLAANTITNEFYKKEIRE